MQHDYFKRYQYQNDADLFAALREPGVEDHDLKSLEKAMEPDRESSGKPSILGHTGKWWEGMVDEGKSGASHIAMLTVANTIAGLLVAYIQAAQAG